MGYSRTFSLVSVVFSEAITLISGSFTSKELNWVDTGRFGLFLASNSLALCKMCCASVSEDPVVDSGNAAAIFTLEF